MYFIATAFFNGFILSKTVNIIKSQLPSMMVSAGLFRAPFLGAVEFIDSGGGGFVVSNLLLKHSKLDL